MLEIWFDLILQFTRTDKVTKTQIFEESLNYNKCMDEIWPKYLQAAARDLARATKTQPMILDQDFFSEMPGFCLRNMDMYKLFTDYTECDLELEVIRAVKNQVLNTKVDQEIRNTVEELSPEDREIT